MEIYRDHPRNAGFYRDDADLHIVFVSDEGDQSVGFSEANFRNWMQDLKPAGARARAHAIVGLPQSTCSDVLEAGTNYQRYANWTGGLAFDLCEPSWAPFFEAVAQDMTGVISEGWTLHQPSEGSLVISLFDGDNNRTELTNEDWILTDQGVEFLVPEPNGRVELLYTPTALF